MTRQARDGDDMDNPNRELIDFLEEQRELRGLTTRSLSVNAGLSPGTVHNITHRKYQPSLFSLNRLADYLGVKREYLWQMAGLLTDMDYGSETNFSDPRLNFHFAQVDKMPREARNMVIDFIQSMSAFLKAFKVKASAPK